MTAAGAMQWPWRLRSMCGGGKRPLKDETRGTWTWISLGEAWRRESQRSQVTQISGILRGRTGLWKGHGFHFKCVVLWSCPGADGNRGWSPDRLPGLDMLSVCVCSWRRWVWVKSPSETNKGEEKKPQGLAQRKSNHPGEEDKR